MKIRDVTPPQPIRYYNIEDITSKEIAQIIGSLFDQSNGAYREGNRELAQELQDLGDKINKLLKDPI